MSKSTLHVVGLPHAPTTSEHCTCAYTAKVLKFCKMMNSMNYDIIHYGVEGSEVECKHVDVLSQEDYLKYFDPKQYLKSYYKIDFDNQLPYWRLMNLHASIEIKSRIKQKDFVCLIGGLAQKPIADELSNYAIVEYGIGYGGVFAPYRVYESYAHQAFLYGRYSNDPDGKFSDAVIPNYFDLNDFTFNIKPQDYYVFVGRCIDRKGLDVAMEATRRAGVKLKVCGQGIEVFGKLPDHVEYCGILDIKRRNEMMGNAIALIAPTKYLEPFGGVVVEAQLCGTPVITTDWGAFPETVEHNMTGYRCRTMEQFVWAIRNVYKLSRTYTYNKAKANYSLEKVGEMFDEYFSSLSTMLFDGGWYADKPREQLLWLHKA